MFKCGNNIFQQASFSVSNPDELWSALQDLISLTKVHNSKSPSLGAGHSLAHIQDTLNLHQRSMPSLQAELHFKINNVIERMILINKDTINSMTKGIKII